jgi:hypothetical protein
LTKIDAWTRLREYSPRKIDISAASDHHLTLGFQSVEETKKPSHFAGFRQFDFEVPDLVSNRFEIRAAPERFRLLEFVESLDNDAVAVDFEEIRVVGDDTLEEL